MTAISLNFSVWCLRPLCRHTTVSKTVGALRDFSSVYESCRGYILGVRQCPGCHSNLKSITKSSKIFHKSLHEGSALTWTKASHKTFSKTIKFHFSCRCCFCGSYSPVSPLFASFCTVVITFHYSLSSYISNSFFKIHRSYICQALRPEAAERNKTALTHQMKLPSWEGSSPGPDTRSIVDSYMRVRTRDGNLNSVLAYRDSLRPPGSLVGGAVFERLVGPEMSLEEPQVLPGTAF